MTFIATTKRLQSGFSLVEMAIVLMIVGLLLGGLLPMLSGQMEQKNRNETRKQLEEISAALVGYAASQTPPKLPCPASPSIATGSNGAGVSDCTIATGMGVVPWVTLGTSETDAWGRRFTYTIASSVSGGVFGASFTLSSTGNLDIYSSSGGSCPSTNCVADNMAAVIISLGANGCGAYLPTGLAQQPNIAAGDGSGLSCDNSGADQVANADGATPFISRDEGSNYDDLVIWISPNILFNRMVAAGKLP
jgi:prepilin-type N-terminal cleavage/methylation domain-containing protein